MLRTQGLLVVIRLEPRVIEGWIRELSMFWIRELSMSFDSRVTLKRIGWDRSQVGQ